MTTNSASDQEKLLITDKKTSLTDQNSTNLGTDAYGTFPNATEIPSVTTTTTTTYQSYPYEISSQTPTVHILGACPACKTGMLEADFTCLGLCCAIFFFPIGIICCLAFRQRRCNFCGVIFP